VFRKDPTRPGGGVFVARDTTGEMDKNIPEGTIINERAEGETHVFSCEMLQRPNAVAWTLDAASSPEQQHQHQHPPMINYAPLGSSYPNVNPAMNGGLGQQHMTIPPGHVQVLNLLDQPSNAPLEQLAMADGFLEGMPSTIFDWGKLSSCCTPLCVPFLTNPRVFTGSWDNFFARMNHTPQQPQQQQQHYPTYTSAPPSGPM
jgi:hypothetical protein